MKLLLAACVMASAAAMAAEKPPFVTREDLASPWIGHGSDGATYRFALNLDGSGLIAPTWPFAEAHEMVSVAGRLVSIDAVSEAYPEESLHMTGKASLSDLDLRVKAKWRNGSSWLE